VEPQLKPARTLTACTPNCSFALHRIVPLEPSLPSLDWFEALIRPKGSYQHWSPSRFIERLYRERSCVLTDLEVFDQVCGWLSERDRPTQISINAHPDSLTDRYFVEHILNAQDRMQEHGHVLCLELIEFGVCEEKFSLVRHARELREAGVLIALDDFGSRINCFDLCGAGIVDVLKIDIRIIREVHHNPFQKAVVESIHLLGRGLGARVVAEGVETDQQVHALARIGVDFAQGFYFHHPQQMGADL